jgi:hypothetical protein
VTRTPSPAEADSATVAALPPQTPTGGEGSKFTVVLSADDAAMFDQLALDIRRELGRRVVKGDLVRTLVALAGYDATVREQLVDQLRARAT